MCMYCSTLTLWWSLDSQQLVELSSWKNNKKGISEKAKRQKHVHRIIRFCRVEDMELRGIPLRCGAIMADNQIQYVPATESDIPCWVCHWRQLHAPPTNIYFHVW